MLNYSTMSFETFLNAALALFAILNPIGNIPLFSDLTDGLDKKSRFTVYNITVVTGFVTLLVMTLTGRWIMSVVFQIDIIEFRIAGGILLTVLAVKHIIFSENRKAPAEDGAERKIMELGAVPMAVPLLVGPGSIVTGILLLDRDGVVITISAIVTVFLVCWVLFQLSPMINHVMGKIGRMVVSRILWIFIAAIGVHFLLSGIKDAFAG